MSRLSLGHVILSRFFELDYTACQCTSGTSLNEWLVLVGLRFSSVKKPLSNTSSSLLGGGPLDTQTIQVPGVSYAWARSMV